MESCAETICQTDTLNVDKSGLGTDVAIAQVAMLSKDIFRTMRRSQSTSDFIVMFGLALRQYSTLTGQDLQEHPYVKVFDNCDSHGDVLDFFRREVQVFEHLQGGDESLIRSIAYAVHDLYSFSVTLGEGIGLIVSNYGSTFTCSKYLSVSHSHPQKLSSLPLGFFSMSR